MARTWTLASVLRPLFRRYAKRDRDAYAAALAATAPPKTGGPPGGSLLRALRTLKLRVTKWGYVVPLHELGQAFLWRDRGARRRGGRNVEPPRPVRVDDLSLAEELAADAQETVAEAFERWDREER